MSEPGRPRISVLLITLNEERLLEEVLRSVSWADEIVILDSGSTDRTAEIARRYTAHFHYHPYTGEGDQRARSLELASGDWIFYIDGDEIVSPELSRAILSAVADPGEYVGFRVEFHTLFSGRWLGRTGWRRERKVRLFRRGHGHFRPSPVHSGAIVNGPVTQLPGPILHYAYRDIEHFASKLNSYSSRGVASAVERGVVSTPAGAVLRGMARFLRDYLFGGDFLNGGAGLVRSSLQGYHTFLKYAKIWEARLPSPTEPSSIDTRTKDD